MFLSHKSNRFYFFVATYSAIFALLAYFGATELSNFRAEQERAAKEKTDQLTTITGNKAVYALPRMELTLAAFQGGTHHVRLGISLEIKKENLERFESFQPRVSDRIIDFLGHQDIDEFERPTGMYNLRRDLLFEVNKASPIVVSDVIFREFIVR